ncbi:MAG: cellulase family glycosylhydrolase [Streptosporangiaceae bacterium]
MENSRVVGWRALMSWRRAAGAAVTLAALMAGGAAPPASAAPTPAGSNPAAQGSVPAPAGASCLKAAGPFSVHGTQVLGEQGQPFVSYGLTVPGLQVLNWRNFTGLDQQKIVAAAVDWCANTVRLQLSQDNLFGPNGTGFDQSYLNAIQSEVALAESYDLVVVINDQTEFGGPIARSTQRGPTAATEAFWKDMASLYGNDPQVIFDLFNEPRMYSPGMSQAQKWQLWLNGGWFGGTFYPFGMAGLAAYVRDTLGARNLLWIEGPDNSDSFAGMVSSGALLKVSGVVYALHHPSDPQDPASWDADFGYLVETGVAPVVDGEWTNYEPVPTVGYQPRRSSCWPNAPTAVPQYLEYLSSLGIGLNAYQFQPGYLIKSYSDLADPTTINARTWNCQSNREPQPGQGAGSLLMAWFEQQNG